jgi:hypothetical protein
MGGSTPAPQFTSKPFMPLSATVKWLSRHTESVLVAFCLFEYCAMAHYLALGSMEKHSRYFAGMDDKSAKRMAIIDLLQGHGWMVVSYALVFLGCLFWMERRAIPRWAFWTSFSAMAAPCLVYGWGCLALLNAIRP